MQTHFEVQACILVCTDLPTATMHTNAWAPVVSWVGGRGLRGLGGGVQVGVLQGVWISSLVRHLLCCSFWKARSSISREQKELNVITSRAALSWARQMVRSQRAWNYQGRTCRCAQKRPELKELDSVFCQICPFSAEIRTFSAEMPSSVLLNDPPKRHPPPPPPPPAPSVQCKPRAGLSFQ